jgi:hypothetical protein
MRDVGGRIISTGGSWYVFFTAHVINNTNCCIAALYVLLNNYFFCVLKCLFNCLLEFIAKRTAERVRDIGITSLYIRMRGGTGATGMGPGAHAAIKTLTKEGFRIISIIDTTRVPRGGPKKKGGKRGRRV